MARFCLEIHHPHSWDSRDDIAFASDAPIQKAAKARDQSINDPFRSPTSRAATNPRACPGISDRIAQSGAETSHVNWSYPRSNLCSYLITYCWLPRTRKGTSNMGESDRRRPRNDQGSTSVGVVFGSLHNVVLQASSSEAGAHPWARGALNLIPSHTTSQRRKDPPMN
jgi:hypothetical protein